MFSPSNCLPGTSHAIAAKQETETPVEYVDDPPGRQASLSNTFYKPSEDEKPYFEKLDEDETRTCGGKLDYDPKKRDKKNVGWFGSVHEINFDKSTKIQRVY